MIRPAPSGSICCPSSARRMRPESSSRRSVLRQSECTCWSTSCRSASRAMPKLCRRFGSSTHLYRYVSCTKLSATETEVMYEAVLISLLRCSTSCLWSCDATGRTPARMSRYLDVLASEVITTHTPSVSNCGRPARPAICPRGLCSAGAEVVSQLEQWAVSQCSGKGRASSEYLQNVAVRVVDVARGGTVVALRPADDDEVRGQVDAEAEAGRGAQHAEVALGEQQLDDATLAGGHGGEVVGHAGAEELRQLVRAAQRRVRGGSRGLVARRRHVGLGELQRSVDCTLARGHEDERRPLARVLADDARQRGQQHVHLEARRDVLPVATDDQREWRRPEARVEGADDGALGTEPLAQCFRVGDRRAEHDHA
mmetsp:Transcript_8473/g.20363  ORF Transcript_8473/g.20363 Transcript_8473/m.20363 type:complete len:369 (-) Transcript_8473:672-1778(-)